jgi:hypothetical protein
MRPYLGERWNSGSTKTAQLASSFAIADTPVARPTSASTSAFPQKRRRPRIPADYARGSGWTSWMMTVLGNRNRADKAQLEAIGVVSPELAAAPSVRAFAASMNERRGRRLADGEVVAQGEDRHCGRACQFPEPSTV